MEWRDLVVMFEGIAMILTAMREMEQGVKTATLKEERLKCTDSESDEGIRGKSKMHRL